MISIVFSIKHNTRVYFFHFDSSETYSTEQLIQTVFTGAECILQELCFLTENLGKKTFCTGDCSPYTFDSLLLHFFKQTRFFLYNFLFFHILLSFYALSVHLLLSNCYGRQTRCPIGNRWLSGNLPTRATPGIDFICRPHTEVIYDTYK